MRGTIVRRGSTWTYWVDLPPDPVTGKRRQTTKGGFRTKRECQAALNEVLVALRSGVFVEGSRRTVRSFLMDEWLPAVRPPALRPGTWGTYRRLLDAYVAPRIGDVELQRLTPPQVSGLYRDLLANGRRRSPGPLEPKTVRNIHLVLHRALKDAVRWGYVIRNVVDVVDAPKWKQAELHIWSAEQLRAFLRHVRADRLYAAWLLIATTGVRRGEIAGLRWVDLDLERARLSVRRPRVEVEGTVYESEPKTAKGKRTISLDPATVTALSSWRTLQGQERSMVGPGYQESGLVFTKPDGAPIHPRRFSDWFEQHARAAGLPAIRFHDVRHSYASAALRAGVPAKVVSERLGHANISITLDTYTHVLPEQDAQAARNVASLILGEASDHESTR
jgi:integrase